MADTHHRDFKIFSEYLKVGDMNIFENDHEVLQIGALTFENQYDSVIITGDVEIFKNQNGKEQAQALYDFAKNLLESLEKADLTTQMPPTKEAGVVDNPFA